MLLLLWVWDGQLVSAGCTRHDISAWTRSTVSAEVSTRNGQQTDRLGTPPDRGRGRLDWDVGCGRNYRWFRTLNSNVLYTSHIHRYIPHTSSRAYKGSWLYVYISYDKEACTISPHVVTFHKFSATITRGQPVSTALGHLVSDFAIGNIAHFISYRAILKGASRATTDTILIWTVKLKDSLYAIGLPNASS